jgi:hypothetical protein
MVGTMTFVEVAPAFDNNSTRKDSFAGYYFGHPAYQRPAHVITLDEMARFHFGDDWVKGSDNIGEYAEGTLENYGQANEQIIMFLDGSDTALNASDTYEPGTRARIYLAEFNDGTWQNFGRYALASSVTENSGTVYFRSRVAWIVPKSLTDAILRDLSNGKTELVLPGEKINTGDLVSYFVASRQYEWLKPASPATVAEMLSLFDLNCDVIEWNGVDTARGYLKSPYTTPDARLIVIREGENVAVGTNEQIGFGKVTFRYYSGNVRDVEGLVFRENYDKFAREVTKDGGWTILKDVHTPFKIDHGWALVFKFGSQEMLRPGTVVEAGESVVYAIPNVDVPFGSFPPFGSQKN